MWDLLCFPQWLKKGETFSVTSRISTWQLLWGRWTKVKWCVEHDRFNVLLPLTLLDMLEFDLICGAWSAEAAPGIFSTVFITKFEYNITTKNKKIKNNHNTWILRYRRIWSTIIIIMFILCRRWIFRYKWFLYQKFLYNINKKIKNKL